MLSNLLKKYRKKYDFDVRLKMDNFLQNYFKN